MIDDEIKDALNVEASPEFLARVRTRIAKEPAPAAWRGPWTLAAAGAMAAVVLGAVIVSRPAQPIRSAETFVAAGPKGPGLQETPGSAHPKGPSPEETPGSAGPKGPALQAEAAAARPVVSGFSRTVLPQQPEILLDPAETRALRALVDGVHAGRIDLAAAQRSTAAEPMVLAPIGELEIRVMTIDPLTPAGEQGARQ
jgi:hypothetical protein